MERHCRPLTARTRGRTSASSNRAPQTARNQAAPAGPRESIIGTDSASLSCTLDMESTVSAAAPDGPARRWWVDMVRASGQPLAVLLQCWSRAGQGLVKGWSRAGQGLVKRWSGADDR